MKKVLIPALGLLLLIVLAACGGNTAVTEPMSGETAVMEDKPTDAMTNESMTSHNDNAAMSDTSSEAMDNHNDDMTMQDTGTEAADGDMAEASMDTMAEKPAWQTIALTNAQSGETFTLGGFAGKTVFVEPMATWCTNCRQQLGNVAQIREQFGDDVIFIALSLETNLSHEELARYAADQGFDWHFAVMTPEMLQSLAETYGRTITNAPSTPHFIIRADGTYTDLKTGVDSPEQLVQFIQGAQS
ncbi:MAG: TlpA family protein disulfide reductase [Chloroflexi bacterium]|nr:TlpA family protein disulfide reductase [Chloroflexota bacterium]MBP7041913.1 TlpA family protein disulfide reductase [Chloroflexota bacterium]